MTRPDAFATASADHERFEIELIAQDRDTDHITTADVDDETARHLVSDLVDEAIVTPVPDERMLVHEPSGEAFHSITQLAVVHRGWTAACDAGEGAE